MSASADSHVTRTVSAWLGTGPDWAPRAQGLSRPGWTRGLIGAAWAGSSPAPQTHCFCHRPLFAFPPSPSVYHSCPCPSSAQRLLPHPSRKWERGLWMAGGHVCRFDPICHNHCPLKTIDNTAKWQTGMLLHSSLLISETSYCLLQLNTLII